MKALLNLLYVAGGDSFTKVTWSYRFMSSAWIYICLV